MLFAHLKRILNLDRLRLRGPKGARAGQGLADPGGRRDRAPRPLRPALSGDSGVCWGPVVSRDRPRSSSSLSRGWGHHDRSGRRNLGDGRRLRRAPVHGGAERLATRRLPVRLRRADEDGQEVVEGDPHGRGAPPARHRQRHSSEQDTLPATGNDWGVIPARSPQLSGCPFYARCPRHSDVCRTAFPPLELVPSAAAHRSACYHPIEPEARRYPQAVTR
jgi:hypothetical protein